MNMLEQYEDEETPIQEQIYDLEQSMVDIMQAQRIMNSNGWHDVAIALMAKFDELDDKRRELYLSLASGE